MMDARSGRETGGESRWRQAGLGLRLALAASILIALGLTAWADDGRFGGGVARGQQATPAPAETEVRTPLPTHPAVYLEVTPQPTPTVDAAVEASHMNGIILWGIILVLIVLAGTLSVAIRTRR